MKPRALITRHTRLKPGSRPSLQSARLLAVLLVPVLGGCAIPGWVPWLSKPVAPPSAEGRPEPRPDAPPPVVPSRTVIVDDEQVADRIVAVVNNDAITLSELQETIALYRQENRGRVTASDEELLRQFLGRLIDARLQLQEAEREKIVVEDQEINEELADRTKRFGVKDVAELEALVKAQGLSIEGVRRRIRDALRAAKVVRRKVALRVTVVDGEIERYLGENREKLEAGLGYHARHIFIVPQGDFDAAWEAARIRAEMIRAQLVAGGDFAELARQHSQDATAKDGGDLGILKRGELTQEIEGRILALDAGQISEPYRSRLGYHVFRLESKDTLTGDSLQRVRQQVREILYRQKYEARLEAWLKEIKERAVIEVRM